MQDSTVVSITVIAGGTAVGVVDLWLNHDGVILSAMLGLYGLVLGYVFGKSSGTNTTTTSTSTTTPKNP